MKYEIERCNMDDDDDTEIEIRSLADLKQSEWLEIQAMARKLYDSGAWGGHQGKIYIQAFFQWLETQESGFELSDNSRPTYH